ncbi:MAG: class I SAM-dependent methyltransferase [Myxococcales bacterium]|nr:class I SAM-dependent methyltransferase [Myxococcales bacterium]
MSDGSTTTTTPPLFSTSQDAQKADLASAEGCRQSILKRPFVQPEGPLPPDEQAASAREPRRVNVFAGLVGGGGPEGAGWLAAQIMSRKNADMNRFAFEQLDVWPRDRVLEIGFGPGRTLDWLVERASEGLVAGVDPAALMVERAARRHSEAIEAGRLELHCCGVSALPFADGTFDKAMAANNFQFWPDYERDLREVRRVLRRGGTLLLCLRAETPGRQSYGPVFSRDDVRDAERLLWRAGFGDVRQRHHSEDSTTLLMAQA